MIVIVVRLDRACTFRNLEVKCSGTFSDYINFDSNVFKYLTCIRILKCLPYFLNDLLVCDRLLLRHLPNLLIKKYKKILCEYYSIKTFRDSQVVSICLQL